MPKKRKSTRRKTKTWTNYKMTSSEKDFARSLKFRDESKPNGITVSQLPYNNVARFQFG